MGSLVDVQRSKHRRAGRAADIAQGEAAAICDKRQMNHSVGKPTSSSDHGSKSEAFQAMGSPKVFIMVDRRS